MQLLHPTLAWPPRPSLPPSPQTASSTQELLQVPGQRPKTPIPNPCNWEASTPDPRGCPVPSFHPPTHQLLMPNPHPHPPKQIWSHRNFSKFLINKEGAVVGRYAPTTTPASLEKEIEKLLSA